MTMQTTALIATRYYTTERNLRPGVLTSGIHVRAYPTHEHWIFVDCQSMGWGRGHRGLWLTLVSNSFSVWLFLCRYDFINYGFLFPPLFSALWREFNRFWIAQPTSKGVVFKHQIMIIWEGSVLGQTKQNILWDFNKIPKFFFCSAPPPTRRQQHCRYAWESEQVRWISSWRKSIFLCAFALLRYFISIWLRFYI